MSINIRLANREDFPQIINTIYEVWRNKENGSESDALEVCNGFGYYYNNFSEYTEQAVALAEDDGRIICIAATIPFPLLNINTNIKAVQLNPVGTLKEYRNTGIAKKCIFYLCEQLTNRGCHILHVTGTPSFYPKLGFHTVYSDYNCIISTDSIAGFCVEGHVINADSNSIENIIKVYNSVQENNLLRVKRDTNWINKKVLNNNIDKLPLGTTKMENIFLAYDKENNCNGYMIISNWGDTICIEEIEALSYNALKLLITKAKNIAENLGIKKININHIMPDRIINPFLLDIRASINYSYPKHSMMKILSIKGFINSIHKVLNKRVKNSCYKDSNFTLLIETQKEKVIIEYTNGEFRVADETMEMDTKPFIIRLSDKSFSLLAFGRNNINDIELNDDPEKPSNDSKEILNILFPKHFPYIYEMDLN